MITYATKTWEYTTDVDTFDLARRKNLIALKVEVGKLGTTKLIYVPTSLNNLKIKVDDLDVGKLKIVPEDLKKISDTVYKQVVKNTKFNTLKTKVNKINKHFLCSYFNSHKSIKHR